MTQKEMDEHILGEFKYLRDRLDGYIDDVSDHRVCVQQQLTDIKVLVADRTGENKGKIAGLTTVISIFVSACVATLVGWLSSKG